MISAIKALQGYLNFSGKKDKGIVVYLEGTQDIPHLMPIIEELKKIKKTVTIVSSESLSIDDYIFIGDGFFRILFFQMLDCKIILMTMPDLERLHIKRSKNLVKYAYVFHSLSSSHTIYHEEAFDAYDIIFAAGPHHAIELKKRENVFSIKKKTILEGGYPRIDSLMKGMPDVNLSKKNKITIAPTWGDGSIMGHENAFEIIGEILKTGYSVFLRLHPMTIRHNPMLIEILNKKFSDYSNFNIETDMGNKNNLYESFLMISDWSGASFDFAFTQLSPVIFIDTKQKINNPDYHKLEVPPAESKIRSEMGYVVPPDDFSELKSKIEEVYQQQNEWREKIKQINNQYQYNIGSGAGKIAEALCEVIDS